MTDKKHEIVPGDIEVKDLERRKFVMSASGVITATALVSISGCGSSRSSDRCDANIGDPVRADSDPTDPIIADSDSGDPCDSD